ncbi:MAG: ABC transporter substrate-binding protein [Oscillospiraceae bacterium]|nr:ABC transporter substrate-binding protein [Oscillospiraceae bacterium]
MKKKLTALLLAVLMLLTVAAFTAGCDKKDDDVASDSPSASSSTSPTSSASTSPTTSDQPPAGVVDPEREKPDDKVLVIGVDATFDAKWNPFLVETAYDHQVVDQVFSPICIIDRDNVLQPYAGSVSYEILPGDNVLYTVQIQDGMYYSDGVKVTIDDFIWGLYVRSDPSYTGPGILLSSHIQGVEEYYYGNPNYSADIAAIEAEAEEKYSLDSITFEDFLIFAYATDLDGWWDGDPAGDIGNGEDWSWYAEVCGYEDELAEIDATNADEMFRLIALIEYEECLDDYDAQEWFLDKLKADYAMGNIGSAADVKEITGINKVDDLTCTVLLTIIDIYGDRGLTTANGSGNLIPRHYYGEIKKGDVSPILSNMNPMGSGPYIFNGYADNIATCTANEDFFLGVPRTRTVRWQYIPSADIVEALISGAIDIANPSASKANVAELSANPQVRYDLIDNAGYGYMAMNTQNVDLYCRKAIWSLMNRQPSVEGYYGTELAAVIERPMTTTLAEYPHGATEYYGYSRDKAIEYFAQAGYTQKDGKLVDENGNQFVINAYIGGGGNGDHPAFAMLVQAAEDLAAIGGEIQIQDVAFSVLTAAMDDGTADMWIMAWASVYDCDKSSQFYSTGGQNRYRFASTKMDAILDEIIQTIDLDARRALVAEMLDLAMDNCLEFPLYQRKNMIAYNVQNVISETIPMATTAADYSQVLWQVAVQ